MNYIYPPQYHMQVPQAQMYGPSMYQHPGFPQYPARGLGFFYDSDLIAAAEKYSKMIDDKTIADTNKAVDDVFAAFGWNTDTAPPPTITPKNPDAMTDEEIWDAQVAADKTVRLDTAAEVQKQIQTLAARVKTYPPEGIDEEGLARIQKAKTAGLGNDIINLIRYVEKWRPYFYQSNGEPYSRPPVGAYTVWEGLKKLATTWPQREYLLLVGFDIDWSTQPAAKAPTATQTIKLPPITITRNRKVDAKTPVQAAGFTLSRVPWWGWVGVGVGVLWWLDQNKSRNRRIRRGAR